LGFLRNILLALGALALAEIGWGDLARAPLCVPLFVLLPYALAGLAHLLGARGRWRLSSAAAAALPWSAPAAELGAVLLGWSGAVERVLGARPGLAAWPGPELLLGLLPYACAELAAIDARARLGDRRPEVRSGLRAFQLRMFLSALAPLVLFVLAASAVAWHPTTRAWVEEVALANGLFAALLLLGFALVLPSLLRNTWDTAPLAAGWQSDVIARTAQQAGFRCKEIRVWHTSNLMANAAVIGFLPQHRVVLFSDALLQELGPAELAAVFAHEIGHAQRRHVWIFAAYALGFFLLADAALAWLALESMTLELGLFAALVLLWYLSFGYLSRRFELDADLESVATTGDVNGLIRALEQVGGAHAREQGSWRHFSVAERVGFLAADARDPGVGRALRRRLRRWAAAGVLLFAVGAGAELWRLARSLPSDRVVVDLRLGRYADAALRAEGAGVDDRLQAAVDAARGVPPEAPPAELVARALARLEAGDARAALALVDLAALREGSPPDGVVAALEALVEDPGDPAQDAAQAVGDAAWREALLARSRG
jgi:Zn-dependent protease with chaperone function